MFNEMDAAGEFVYFNVGNNSFHQSLIDQALKGLPEVQATALPADYEGNQVTEEKVAALVTANPDLKAIWSNEGLENIFWGSKNAQTKSAPAILCASKKDILQSWKERIAEDPSFRCLATVKPGGTGYEGVYAAYYLLSGLKIDPAALGGLEGNTFIYDFPVITNDNLDQWLAKIDSLQIGEWDTLEMPPMTSDEIKEKWFLE
jgi:ABC-type sugar transport system substrate-binding protein